MNEPIAIIIPTRNRFNKLKRCLLNLKEVDYPKKEILVVCDNDLETYNKLMLNPVDGIKLLLTERLEFVGAVRYGIKRCESDFFVYYNDDMLMDVNCLDVAIREFNDKFKDGIGLVGFDDSINLFIGTVGLTNKKTVEKFDAFPDAYIHFYSDTELGLRCRKAGCFFWSHDAKVDHIHPITKRAILDPTYIDSSKNLEHDRRSFVNRNGNYSHQSRDAIERGL